MNTNIAQTEEQAYFEDAVAEYIHIRESVASAFLFGIIRMGWVLHKHREELKRHGKWLDFCKTLGIHISQANQQIRMFEMSLTNSRIDVIKKTITNWTKLNAFLSLPEDIRDEVVEMVESGEIPEDITANELNDVIEDVKDRHVDEDTITTPSGRNPLHEDSKFAADLIMKASGFSPASRPFLEAYSSIQKGVEILREQSSYPKSEDEKNNLKEILETQIKELSIILTTL